MAVIIVRTLSQNSGFQVEIPWNGPQDRSRALYNADEGFVEGHSVSSLNLFMFKHHLGEKHFRNI